LKEWWSIHPASQLRILVSIRDDFLGKLAVIQERLAYVSTIHNYLRLRKFTPDDATDVLRAMAAKSDFAFNVSAVRQICREELGSSEDGTVSPVDLQILATGVRDLPIATRGFTADALRSMGGLEGALERYFPAQLSNPSAEDRKIALAGYTSLIYWVFGRTPLAALRGRRSRCPQILISADSPLSTATCHETSGTSGSICSYER
jgi:hypothetical protein